MARTKKSGCRRCPICGHHADRKDMRYTTDANGIRCRLVCWDCYDQIMVKGYDDADVNESESLQEKSRDHYRSEHTLPERA